MFGELKKQQLIVAVVMLALLFGAGVRYGRYLAGATPQPVLSEAAGAVSQLDPAEPASPAEVTVYVTGAVSAPGVFTLKEGSRVVDALDLAKADGQADLSRLNLAKKLSDGEKILVPLKKPPGEAGQAEPGTADQGESGESADSLININQAEAADLEKLPGIGPSKAQAIIKYRLENGDFRSLEDLDKVPGIGSATLKNLQEKIAF